MSKPTLWLECLDCNGQGHEVMACPDTDFLHTVGNCGGTHYHICLTCHGRSVVPVAAGAVLIEDWEWLRRLIVKACERYGGEPRMVADAVVAAAAAEGRET